MPIVSVNRINKQFYIYKIEWVKTWKAIKTEKVIYNLKHKIRERKVL